MIRLAILGMCLLTAFPAYGARRNAPEAEDITPLIGKIDYHAGEITVRLRCIKCHEIEKGANNIITGPNLWGVYNRPIGSESGFAYSDALKNLKGKSWNYIELNKYLFNPGGYALGTRMPFLSLRDAQERANIIGWLSTLYDAPAAAHSAPSQPTDTPATPRQTR